MNKKEKKKKEKVTNWFNNKLNKSKLILINANIIKFKLKTGV